MQFQHLKRLTECKRRTWNLIPEKGSDLLAWPAAGC
jgi:hypothetical protein